MQKIIEKIPKHIWILLGIILLGIFLRAYNFHDWLDFGSDQVKDITVVSSFIKGETDLPLLGPDMSNSGDKWMKKRFRIGPMYYYFEIISAKIFGNKPEAMAYPDLIFSILSIPLFYYFLRKIFDTNLSLSLAGLYTISFYSLSFSHSAWNVNSIPFFSLLFLLSLYEFIVGKEKTRWKWIIALGISLGVGIQLHAVLLVLFPLVSFFTFALFMRKNSQIWKKMAGIIFIMIILNLGQIVYEVQTNLKNSRTFLTSVNSANASGYNSPILMSATNLSCNFQANLYMLSSVGNPDCDISLTAAIQKGFNDKILEKFSQPLFILKIIICALFSIIGYGLLIYYYKKEREQKRKYFFILIVLYTAVSFIIMLPVIDAPFRYFVHIIFLPFIFLGLAINFLMQKFSRRYFIMAVSVFAFLALSNSFSTYLEIKNEFANSRITLGQVEAMADYIISQENSQKEIYIFTTSKTDAFFNSLKYIADEKGVSFLRAKKGVNIPAGKPRFYLEDIKDVSAGSIINGHNFDNYKNFNFNQTTVFHLTN